VPEGDVRKILGENVAGFLALDRAALGEVTARVGVAPGDVLGTARSIDADLRANLDRRCGFSKPSEGDSRLAQAEAMLEEDLALALR
jgi:hypothetical protein